MIVRQVTSPSRSYMFNKFNRIFCFHIVCLSYSFTQSVKTALPFGVGEPVDSIHPLPPTWLEWEDEAGLGRGFVCQGAD